MVEFDLDEDLTIRKKIEKHLIDLQVPHTTKFCYYAHCKSIYNTPQETRDYIMLKELGFFVYSPNNDFCQQLAREHGMTGFVVFMDYFDVLAFRALPDGRIPSGVFTEVTSFHGPVIELPSSLKRRSLTYSETIEYLREVGER